MRWFALILVLVVVPAFAGESAVCQSPSVDRVSALSLSGPLVLEQSGAPELRQVGGTADSLGIFPGAEWDVSSRSSFLSRVAKSAGKARRVGIAASRGRIRAPSHRGAPAMDTKICIPGRDLPASHLIANRW